MSDERPDRSAWPYAWAVAVGAPGYALVHYSSHLALDILGGVLLVLGVAPVVLLELWGLLTLPLRAAEQVSPGPDAARNRALRKVEQRKLAARRSLAEAARERDTP